MDNRADRLVRRRPGARPTSSTPADACSTRAGWARSEFHPDEAGGGAGHPAGAARRDRGWRRRAATRRAAGWSRGRSTLTRSGTSQRSFRISSESRLATGATNHARVVLLPQARAMRSVIGIRPRARRTDSGSSRGRGRVPATSGVAELMSISLLNPSAYSRNVRRQPAGSAGSAERVEGQRDLVARARGHEHVVGAAPAARARRPSRV